MAPRKSLQERLEQLRAKEKTLSARLGAQQRKDDTRRKVLLGALVLQELSGVKPSEFTVALREWLARELPGFLTRDQDKALLRDLVAAEQPTE